MTVPSLNPSHVDASKLPIEQLAGSKQVSEPQKIAAASQAFEALLLRQILQESQKPVFASKFVGNSFADGIYRDLVVNQLAENISKTGSIGLAKTFTAQVQRQAGTHPHRSEERRVGKECRSRW